MRIIVILFCLIISGCDHFSIGSHAFQEYERMCNEFGGLERAYFYLGDNNKVILKYLKCKNGVTLEYDYVKEKYISEKNNAT